jgi:tetratricopeptide (TPR) repeat protein
LIVLGHIAFARGELGEAKGFYQRCLTIAQEIGFYYAIQTSSKYLGKVTLSLGEIIEAETYLVESLRISKEIGFVRDLVNLLYEYARLRVARGNPEGAVELLGLVLQHPASKQVRLIEGNIGDSAEDLLVELKAELPQGVYGAALERGRELELDGVVADLLGRKRRG